MLQGKGRGLTGLLLSTLASACITETVTVDPAVEELGERIFFDEGLSKNGNQSCAACHAQEVGWTGPIDTVNAHGAVYEGSVAGRFGNRKPPASAYATMNPLFDFDPETGFFGGSFWDGRATGWKLGNPAADQAQGPFLNPAEQALPDAAAVVHRVCVSDYAALFRALWGAEICGDVEAAYDDIARSIAAFEDSKRVNRFDSKYDAYLAGRAELTAKEERGRQLFEGKAGCSTCHLATVEDGQAGPLLADFGYDNLGIPRNPENPFYDTAGRDWVDPGLAGFVAQLAADDGWRKLPYVTRAVKHMTAGELSSLVEQNLGKHRTPTLRNVALRPSPKTVKSYGHNGYFKTLKGFVHFYNTRDVLPRCEGDLTEREALKAGCWPAPEVSDNLNREELGALGLTDAEEDAIVAFLETLSDGWM